ncbi:pyridoxamine 5'-phosphate oxidase family protein [Nocardioides sp. GXQ0305]|uniref:pyridoxamine 5'-phosphate oxidase family protein n=1 Tax=Nocardioides sp. GXQ0305 TaxID=3423912 RepID=UPI003D7E0C1F
MTLDDLTRMKEMRRRDRAELDRLLDEELAVTLATVTDDGRPWAVPMLHARVGDRVLLHGSTGAGALRRVADGAEAVLAVHAIDALVLATSLFEHSANYRSAVVRGPLVRLTGDDAVAALDALSDVLVPGRRGELRGHLPKELAATVALALDITDDNWLLKVSDGDVDEELDVVPDDVWTGILPIHRSYGEPVRSPWLPADLPAPPSVDALRAAGPQRRGGRRGQRRGTNR